MQLRPENANDADYIVNEIGQSQEGIMSYSQQQQYPTTKSIKQIQSLRHEYRSRRAVRSHQSKAKINWHIPKQSLIIINLYVDLALVVCYLLDVQYAQKTGFWFWDRWISLWFVQFILSWWVVAVMVGRILANYKVSMRSFIDLTTAVPFVIMSFVFGPVFWIPFFMRIWTLQIDLIHLLRFRVFTQMLSQIVMFVMSAVAFFITWMCLFQFIEQQYGFYHDVLECLYYVVITTSTVGYGDVTPKTGFGRLLAVFMIALAIIYLPQLISAIIETYNQHKDGMRQFQPKNKEPFVVVSLSYSRDQFIRDVLNSALSALAAEHRFTKHKHVKSITYKLVLLSHQPLSQQVKLLLRTNEYKDRVVFISGSSLEESDLKRTCIQKASACFVIADRSKVTNVEEAQEEDHKNVLRIWSLKKFAPKVPIFAYNLRPETEIHVKPLSRQVVCVTTIKQIIMGVSCLHPGAATLVTNLIHQAPRLKKYTKTWQVLYSDGLANGIHIGPFIKLFENRLYSELCWYLYAEFQVVLIGIKFKVAASIDAQEAKISTPNNSKYVYTFKEHIVLNPGSGYKIPGDGQVQELIFVAQSFEDVADLEHLSEEQFARTWSKWIDYEDDIYGDNLQSKFQVHSTGHECQLGCLSDPIATSTKIKAEDIAEHPVLSDEEPPSPKVKSKRFDYISKEDNHKLQIGSDTPLAGSDTELLVDEQNDEPYVGHPRPPHHMVIDNDLQSPFCHMLKQPAGYESSRILDATRAESFTRSYRSMAQRKRGTFIVLKDHIIVCAASFEIFAFLCTVRAAFLNQDTLKPILLMCPDVPTEEQWRPLAVFPQVYYMKGSALKRNDMIKAGLCQAQSVIMLKHPSHAVKSKFDERFVDSTVVMATHQIDFMTKDKYVLSELVTRNNIKFMRIKHEMLDCLPKLTTSLPEGIRPFDITHTMKRFTYRRTVPLGALASSQTEVSKEDNSNEHHKHRQEENLFDQPDIARQPAISTEDPGYYAHSVVYASGRVLPGDMFDNIIFQTFRTPGLVDIVKLLCGRRYQRWTEINQHLGLQGSVLHSFNLPKQFFGQPFVHLFKHLSLIHGCTVLGIYRRKTRQDVDNDLRQQSNKFGVSQTMPLPSQNAFSNIPLGRFNTGASVLSQSSNYRHLFRIDDNPLNEDINSQSINMNTFNNRSAKMSRLAQLLDEVNRVDNDLPFFLTNPLPDFILDDMDQVFVLKPIDN